MLYSMYALTIEYVQLRAKSRPAAGRLADRLAHQANPEDRILGFVQKLHLPIGILLEAARNAADQIGADRRHLAPGRVAVFAFIGLVGRSGISAVVNAKEVQRHFSKSMRWTTRSPIRETGPAKATSA